MTLSPVMVVASIILALFSISWHAKAGANGFNQRWNPDVDGEGVIFEEVEEDGYDYEKMVHSISPEDKGNHGGTNYGANSNINHEDYGVGGDNVITTSSKVTYASASRIIKNSENENGRSILGGDPADSSGVLLDEALDEAAGLVAVEYSCSNFRCTQGGAFHNSRIIPNAGGDSSHENAGDDMSPPGPTREAGEHSSPPGQHDPDQSEHDPDQSEHDPPGQSEHDPPGQSAPESLSRGPLSLESADGFLLELTTDPAWVDGALNGHFGFWKPLADYEKLKREIYELIPANHAEIWLHMVRETMEPDLLLAPAVPKTGSTYFENLIKETVEREEKREKAQLEREQKAAGDDTTAGDDTSTAEDESTNTMMNSNSEQEADKNMRKNYSHQDGGSHVSEETPAPSNAQEESEDEDNEDNHDNDNKKSLAELTPAAFEPGSLPFEVLENDIVNLQEARNPLAAIRPISRLQFGNFYYHNQMHTDQRSFEKLIEWLESRVIPSWIPHFTNPVKFGAIDWGAFQRLQKGQPSRRLIVSGHMQMQDLEKMSANFRWNWGYARHRSPTDFSVQWIDESEEEWQNRVAGTFEDSPQAEAEHAVREVLKDHVAVVRVRSEGSSTSGTITSTPAVDSDSTSTVVGSSSTSSSDNDDVPAGTSSKDGNINDEGEGVDQGKGVDQGASSASSASTRTTTIGLGIDNEQITKAQALDVNFRKTLSPRPVINFEYITAFRSCPERYASMFEYSLGGHFSESAGLVREFLDTKSSEVDPKNGLLRPCYEDWRCIVDSKLFLVITQKGSFTHERNFLFPYSLASFSDHLAQQIYGAAAGGGEEAAAKVVTGGHMEAGAAKEVAGGEGAEEQDSVVHHHQPSPSSIDDYGQRPRLHTFADIKKRSGIYAFAYEEYEWFNRHHNFARVVLKRAVKTMVSGIWMETDKKREGEQAAEQDDSSNHDGHDGVEQDDSSSNHGGHDGVEQDDSSNHGGHHAAEQDDSSSNHGGHHAAEQDDSSNHGGQGGRPIYNYPHDQEFTGMPFDRDWFDRDGYAWFWLLEEVDKSLEMVTCLYPNMLRGIQGLHERKKKAKELLDAGTTGDAQAKSEALRELTALSTPGGDGSRKWKNEQVQDAEEDDKTVLENIKAFDAENQGGNAENQGGNNQTSQVGVSAEQSDIFNKTQSNFKGLRKLLRMIFKHLCHHTPAALLYELAHQIFLDRYEVMKKAGGCRMRLV